MKETVVIGVGGIGAEICAQVSQMMPKNAPDKNHIEFVIMDTDANQIRELRRNGFRGEAIQLSDNMTVGKCIEILGEQIKEWYPISGVFDRKSMTEGAGQQRAISRLAWEFSLANGGTNKLISIIHRLQNVTIDDENPEILFYIISSLAGGTGSGIILPLASYLNQFVMEELGDHQSRCKGFFVLSSAFKERTDSDPGSRLEQVSLDSNAYAAVKELADAMRQDDEKNTSSMTTFRDSYEYCYLFGMANERGKRLRSLSELKRLIASAVYMQALSPIRDRNSSREDNKIRHGSITMLKEGEEHLRRFGGIGCGELVYPYDLLRKYYALRWAGNVMEAEWRKYDNLFNKKVEEQRERKRQGKKTEPLNRGDEYIRAVNSADQLDFLAEDIRKFCQTDSKDNTWDCYLIALKKEIDRQVDNIRENNSSSQTQNEYEFNRHLMTADRKDVKRKELIESADEIIKKAKEIKPGILSIADTYGSSISQMLFGKYPMMDNSPEYYMEYWLVKDKQFIHPNAVRYFLYNLKACLPGQIKLAEKHIAAASSPYQRIDTRKPVKKCFFSKKKFKNMRDEYKKAWDALYDHEKWRLYKKALEDCNLYISKLIDAYESFYDSYEEMLLQFAKDAEEIVRELDRREGTTKAYVCANAVCRDEIEKRMQGNREYVKADSGLSYEIYQMIQGYQSEQREWKKSFQQIRKYWLDGLDQTYGAIIDINILQALDREMFLTTGNQVTAHEMEEKIRSAGDILIAPFLQYHCPDGNNLGISLYCYNSRLNTETGMYQEVVRWMVDQDAVDDDTYCSPYQIIFYRSFVGLEAYEVLEYLHGRGNTCMAAEGKAFQAYAEIMRDMGKPHSIDPVITPHIDKRWHNFQYLPDANRSYQREREVEIAQAFLWSYLKEYIKKNQKGDYRFTFFNASMEMPRLVDFHDNLYGNFYWTDCLLDDFHEELQVNKRSATLFFIQGKEIFVCLLQYCREMLREEIDAGKLQLLIEAVHLLVYECVDGKDHKEKCEKSGLMMKEQREKLKKSAKTSSYENSNVVLEAVEDYYNRGKIQ